MKELGLCNFTLVESSEWVYVFLFVTYHLGMGMHLPLLEWEGPHHCLSCIVKCTHILVLIDLQPHSRSRIYVLSVVTVSHLMLLYVEFEPEKARS